MTSKFAARLIVAVVALLTVAPLAAQGPVTVPGSQQFLMKSAGNGVEYRIDVALPSGYAGSQERYPVFYILDSNLAFATLVDTYRMLRIDGSVPEMIVVGIGYQEDDPAVYTPAYEANRSRDYTPTAVDTTIPGSGHARAFLTFISAEVIPMIEGRYRTDPADRALGGHSLGGLFTTYALLTEPALFHRYWIGSPSLWWNDGVSFSYLAPALARATKPAGRAFLSVGALETAIMVPPMKRMATELEAKFPTLEVASMVYPDETHMSVIGASISRALRFLYHRARVPIKPADLPGYLGRWKSPAGETITLAARGPRLYFTMAVYGTPITMELFAETRDHLFGEALAVDLAADRNAAGRVTTLRRTFLGAETAFERVR